MAASEGALHTDDDDDDSEDVLGSCLLYQKKIKKSKKGALRSVLVQLHIGTRMAQGRRTLA